MIFQNFNTQKLVIAIALILLSGCRGSKYGQYSEDEVTVINVHPGQAVDPVAFREMEEARNSGGYASRGLFDSYGSTAAGLIFTGVKTLIKKEKEKYNKEYDFVIEPKGHHVQNDSFYFYRNTSDIAFNPSDMQFSGFTLIRMSGTDTAIRAVFEVDRSNLAEIFYDGIFRLKLTELEYNYAKAKVYARGDNRVNLDFDINFYASYISKDGQLNSNVKVGSFALNLPGVYLHNNDSCRKFEGTRLEGYSFLVPRSYGYSVAARKGVFSQGAFSIHVNVKETSKPKIINKFFTEHSDQIFEHVNMNGEKKE